MRRGLLPRTNQSAVGCTVPCHCPSSGQRRSHGFDVDVTRPEASTWQHAKARRPHAPPTTSCIHVFPTTITPCSSFGRRAPSCYRLLSISAEPHRQPAFSATTAEQPTHSSVCRCYLRLRDAPTYCSLLHAHKCPDAMRMQTTANRLEPEREFDVIAGVSTQAAGLPWAGECTWIGVGQYPCAGTLEAMPLQRHLACAGHPDSRARGHTCMAGEYK